ncbi:MAG: MerR family transcriptional regulator [Cyanophyceae cyanobacterium]
MLKIGDFSTLSQVSVKALRHYDRLGLLQPAQVDSDTGYRFYTANQLPRLNRILAFKNLGFPLDTIAQLLDEDGGVSIETLRGMLRLKQVELEQTLRDERARLTRVATYIHHLEQGNTMTNIDVVIKGVAPIRVASIREALPNYHAIGPLIGEIEGAIAQQSLPCSTAYLGIWHDEGYKEEEIDGDASLGVAEGFVGSDRIRAYELPGWDNCACLVHAGAYNTLKDAYTNLVSWIEANGYRIVGPSRDVYLVGGPDDDDTTYVTEIQFPVEVISP